MLNYRVETLPADEAGRCKVFEFAKERVLKPSLPVPTRRCFPSLINWPANSQSMWRLTTASLQDRVGRPSKQRQTDRCAARHRPDNDYGLSWIKTYGKGRVFNTWLGHTPELFTNPALAQHILGAIPFILGDLDADTTPTGKLELEDPRKR